MQAPHGTGTLRAMFQKIVGGGPCSFRSDCRQTMGGWGTNAVPPHLVEEGLVVVKTIRCRRERLESATHQLEGWGSTLVLRYPQLTKWQGDLAVHDGRVRYSVGERGQAPHGRRRGLQRGRRGHPSPDLRDLRPLGKSGGYARVRPG